VVQLIVVQDYRGDRIEIVAQLVDAVTALDAEQASELWARRWIDRHGRSM
jgi:TolB-like protein